MAATSAQPTPSGQPQVAASGDPELATTDEVKEYCHEGPGDGENSMDLHDIKSELGKDAEESETPKVTPTTTTNPVPFNTSTNTSVVNPGLQFRPTVVQPMVYANGFMVPPFATSTPLYPVTAGIRPVKMEVQGTADWSKTTTGQGISIPYGYPTGFVSTGLPVDQSLRPTAYPFLMSGQYVAQMSYPQQLTAFGAAAAPNAAVQPHSGVIAPQQKEKKPHIKKPLNAFMLFMKEKRAEVIKECTLKESAAINQILGKMWHKLEKSEQAKYYEMAREERAKHMQMYPGWSARDNYAAHKKRRKKRQKQQPEEDSNKQANQEDETAENAKETDEPSKKSIKVEDNLKDSQDNLRKCRARFGMEQQHMWCNPCRRKKKCVRADDDFSNDKCKISNDESDDMKPDQTSLKLTLDNNTSS